MALFFHHYNKHYLNTNCSSNMTYTMSSSVRSRDMGAHLSAYIAASPNLHVNAEQRSRRDLVQDLIVALGFLSDASLSDDLRNGKITYKPYNLLNTFTLHDVTLNRRLRKECPHAAANYNLRVMPTSLVLCAPGRFWGFSIRSI